MNLELQVLASRAIRDKRPWPKMGWLWEPKQAKQGLHMFNKGRLCQVSVTKGTTHRKFPALSDLEISIVAHSSNGAYVAGLLSSGDLFIWNKELDKLEVHLSPFSKLMEKIKSDVNAYSRFRVFVSDSGEQVFVLTEAMIFYMWEASPERHHWWKLFPPAEVRLPSESQRETALDCGFYVHQVLEEIAICGLVFTDRDTNKTTITHVLINWASSSAKFYSSRSNKLDEDEEPVLFPLQLFQDPSVAFSKSGGLQHDSGKVDSVEEPMRKISVEGKASLAGSGAQFGALWSDLPPFRVSWGSISCPVSTSPSHSGRGTYVYCLSPAGDLSAVVVNQKQASETRVIFFSPLNQVGISVKVYLQTEEVWSGRTFWITAVSWLCSGLFLACMNKRGSLMILPRHGPPLLLISQGCGVDLGPRHLLPLHPLVTITGPSKKLITDHETSECSERDQLRQKFSVVCHPTEPLLVCSDGYNFTLLKISSKQDLLVTVKSLIMESRRFLDIEHKGCLSNCSDGADDDDDRGLCDSSGLDFRDLVASLDCDQSGSKGKDSLKEKQPHFLSKDGRSANSEGFLDKYLKNLETGRIEFASESRRAPRSLRVEGADRRSDGTLRQALLYLQSAVGLLLSCDSFVPCQGAWPSSPFPTPGRAEELKKESEDLSTLLLSTISKVLSQASLLNAFSTGSMSSEMVVLTLDFTRALLKLIVQDSFPQASARLSLPLANVILLGFLYGWFKRHLDFNKLDQGEHTVVSLLEYADIVGKGMLDFSNLLEDLIQVLLSSYDMYPSIIGQVSSSHFSTHPSSNCVLYLSSSLNVALKLIALLWKDMKTCRNLSTTASHLPGKHLGLQLSRKTVAQNVSNTAKDACGTLKSMHVYIQLLLQSSTGSKASVSHSSSSKTYSSRGNGKPITYNLPNGPGGKMAQLVDYLKNYDVLAALELAKTCIELVTDKMERKLGTSVEPVNEEHAADVLDMWIHSDDSNPKFVRVTSDMDRELIAILGKFMALYFTDQKLLVLSSSSPSLVDQLGLSWKLELCRSRLMEALKEGGAWEFWTVERTLSFLLLSNNWAEACEFAFEVGDWRKAFVLAAAHSLHHKLVRQDALDSSEGCLFVKAQELGLSNMLKVVGTVFRKLTEEKFQKRYQGTNIGTPSIALLRSGEHFLSETFRVFASVEMEGLIVSMCEHYLGELEEACQKFTIKVPSGLHLPAPPLYCSQPAITKEEYVQCPQELHLRHCVGVTVQRLLLVLRSSGCLLHCASWYARHLISHFLDLPTETREALQMPSTKREPRTTPAYLKKLSTRGTGGGGSSVEGLCVLLQRLCSLLWFLRVRDQVSCRMRKLQPSSDHKTQATSDLLEEAAQWSARLLPFSDLLPRIPSIEHLLFTILSELPSNVFLVDILAYCFPDDSPVKNDKIDKILSRLKPSSDLESKSLSLSAQYDQRRKLVQSCLKNTFGECCGRFTGNKIKIPDEKRCGNSVSDAPKLDCGTGVGKFLFECDQEYLNFVDSLFGVIVFPVQQDLQQTSLHSAVAPMSLFERRITVPKGSSASMTLYPVIGELIRWTRLSLPSRSSMQDNRRTSSESLGKVARRRSRLGSLSMRIALSAPVIVSALRQIEPTSDERRASRGGTDGESEKDLQLFPKEVGKRIVDSGHRSNSSPRRLGGLAKDEHGRVYLLQIPDGLFEEDDSSEEVLGSSSPTGGVVSETKVQERKDQQVAAEEPEPEDSQTSSAGEISLDATLSYGEFPGRVKFFHESESSSTFPLSSTMRQSHVANLDQDKNPQRTKGPRSIAACGQQQQQKAALDISAIGVGGADMGVVNKVPPEAREVGSATPDQQVLGLEDSVETLTLSVSDGTPTNSCSVTLTDSSTATLMQSTDTTLTEVTHNSPLTRSPAVPNAVTSKHQELPCGPQDLPHSRHPMSSPSVCASSINSTSSLALQLPVQSSSSTIDCSTFTSTPHPLQPVPASHSPSQQIGPLHLDMSNSGGNSLNVTAQMFTPQTPHHQQQPLVPTSVTYTVNLGPTLSLSPSHAIMADKGNQTSLAVHSGHTSSEQVTKEMQAESVSKTPAGIQPTTTSPSLFQQNVSTTTIATTVTTASPPSALPSGHVHQGSIVTQSVEVPVASEVPQPTTTDPQPVAAVFSSPPTIFTSPRVDVLQENIATIVRSEVKATLQEQHLELLNLLKSKQADSDKLGKKKKRKSKPIMTSTKIHDSKNELDLHRQASDQSPSVRTSEDNLPRVPTLEDLETGSESECLQSSDPPTVSHSEQCLTPSREDELDGGQKEDVQTDAANEHKLHVTDLESDDDPSSPGAFPVVRSLSCSMESGIEEARKGGEKNKKVRMEHKMAGLEAQSGMEKDGRGMTSTLETQQQWSRDRHAPPTLLRVGSLDLAQRDCADPSLEDVFPEVVSNLRKFDSSVLPGWRGGDVQTDSGATEQPSKKAAPGIPLFQLPPPKMATSSQSRDQGSIPTSQSERWAHQPPPLFHFSPVHQPPPFSLHQSSQVAQHSSAPPPHSLSSFQPPSVINDIKFPLLLPQVICLSSNTPPCQGLQVPPHLSQVNLPHIPASLPSKAPSSKSTPQSCAQVPSNIAPLQAPPPPQLLQVPGLFSTGVVPTLLVPPEQLLKQQESNIVNLPHQLRVDEVLTRKMSALEQVDVSVTVPAEKSPRPAEKAPILVEKAQILAEKILPPAEEAPSPAEKAPLVSENDSLSGLSSLTSTSSKQTDVSSSTASSMPHSGVLKKAGGKKSSKWKCRKKRAQVCEDSTAGGHLFTDNEKLKDERKQPEGQLVSGSTPDSPHHLSQTSANVAVIPQDAKGKTTARMKVPSETEKMMKQKLKDAENLSKKLRLSGGATDLEEVPVPPTTWAEPSKDMAHLPDRLEPLESLEARRLNFYKIVPEPELSTMKSGEKGLESDEEKSAFYKKKDSKRNKEEESGIETKVSDSLKDDTASSPSKVAVATASVQVNLSTTRIISIPPSVHKSAPEVDSTATTISSRTLTPDSLDASNHSSAVTSILQDPPKEVVPFRPPDLVLSPASQHLQLTHTISPEQPQSSSSSSTPHSPHLDLPSPQGSQSSLSLTNSQGSSKFLHSPPEEEETEVVLQPRQDLLEIKLDTLGVSGRPPPSLHRVPSHSSDEEMGMNKLSETQSSPPQDTVRVTYRTHSRHKDSTRTKTTECVKLPPSVDVEDYTSSEQDTTIDDDSLRDVGSPPGVGLPAFNLPTQHSSRSSKYGLERDPISLELLLREMRSSSGRKEAMKTFLQLEDQLSALQISVRALDGGFRQSNKILKTIDHLTEASELAGSHDEPDAAHSDNVSVSSDGYHSRDFQDAQQVARIYRDFKRLQGEEQDYAGGMSRGGEEAWLPLNESEEEGVDEKVAEVSPAGRHGGVGGTRREAESVMVLHGGQRWSKEQLQEWRARKGKIKRKATQDIGPPGGESSKGSKKELDMKKPKLEPQSPRKLKCSKSFLEDARLKRLEDAHVLMADIISSQKANIPKSFAHSRQSSAKPSMQNTYTIRQDHVSSAAGHVTGIRGQPSKNGMLGKNSTATKSIMSHPNANVELGNGADSAAPDTRKYKRRVSFEMKSVDHEQSSITSGSILSNIDWDEVDRILDS